MNGHSEVETGRGVPTVDFSRGSVGTVTFKALGSVSRCSWTGRSGWKSASGWRAQARKTRRAHHVTGVAQVPLWVPETFRECQFQSVSTRIYPEKELGYIYQLPRNYAELGE